MIWMDLTPFISLLTSHEEPSMSDGRFTTNDRVEQRPDRHVVTWSCDGPFPARRRAATKARATAFNPGGTGRSDDWSRNRPTGRRHASISGKRNDQVYLPPVLFGSSRR
ncbi:hypothetical protein EAG_10854 [Camponotus floridanus]|uniref:Uncharacterized protein n=1 Tax=Camponotus floridanus TaxID=104421 RepID=E2A9K2_CAMFO|nr:hypothetical protein EAG_10854 [Camponotus floridanus]